MLNSTYKEKGNEPELWVVVMEGSVIRTSVSAM